MLNTNYQTKFNEIYAALNTEQQQAVNAIEGPVMVIAGPGTGKTQILAARIANILVKTDVLPENILCLTYTDAGTIAMRKRLNQFIGPDSYRVGIFTFHGFCNLVIQENLDVFGFRNLDPVSELEQIQYVREIIDNLTIENPLKRYTGDAYFEVGRLLSLYEIIKKEDLTPEFIHLKITEYVNGLENRDEYIYKRAGKRKDGLAYVKGDLNTDKINAEIDRMNLLAAAVNTFSVYQEKLRLNKRYDFADMLIWVIDAFKNTDSLLSNYQERYQYILVDEFQDTNGSQNDILTLLSNYWHEPNLFVVGDEDQSIYRFQGANVENIKTFKETYIKDEKSKIVLTKNYRSTQLILNGAAAIINKSNPKNRLDINKELHASNPKIANLVQKPIVAEFTNLAEEIVFISNQIITLINAGAEPKEIAVIYRNHKQANEIITYLQFKNIGINARKRENILEQTVIKKLLCILQFIQAELKISHSGEGNLFELLHYPEFGLPAIEIAKMATAISSKNFSERKTSWREELKLFNLKSKPDLFNNKNFATKFVKVSEILEDLIKQATQVTLQELIFQVINKCGLLVHALNHNDSQWNLELINTFFNYIKTETLKKPSYNLKNLIDAIELIETNNLRIEAEKIFAHANGVNFMTSHASKGLEFEHVFVLGCTTQIWDKAKSNRGYKLPDNLLGNSVEEDEETRRLFYVALTRAKTFLQISFSNKDLNEKELEPSVFIAELNESNAVENIAQTCKPEDIEDFFKSIYTLAEPNLPQGILQSGYVDELLEKYSLSVTHLNNYLKCPLSFYFNNFIRVPAPKSGAMTFGSAVHHGIEQLFKKMLDSEPKEFPSVQTLLNDFKWYMYRHRDSFTDADFERRLEYAQKILPDYYNKYLTSWNKVAVVERPYRNINMEGVLISGKLDKLEFDGNFVNVVDYKTGKYKNAKPKFNRPDKEKVEAAKNADKEPKFEEEFGGDYWRQAVFYKLLLDYDKTRDWMMRTSEFDFVEPDKDTGEYYKEKVTITSADIDIVKLQIKQVYGKIKNKEFDKGCGKDDCQWCNFTREFYSGATTDLPELDQESTENN